MDGSGFADDSRVLPLYLTVDVSSAMAGNPLNGANELIPLVIDTFDRSRVASELLRISLVGFSDAASVIIPMSEYRTVIRPTLTTAGTASYTAVFTELRKTIACDVNALKEAGHHVFRPVVIMFTAARPTDPEAEWHTAFRLLAELKESPHIAVVGFDNADAELMRSFTQGRGQVILIADDHEPSAPYRAAIDWLIGDGSASHPTDPEPSLPAVLPDLDVFEDHDFEDWV